MSQHGHHWEAFSGVDSDTNDILDSVLALSPVGKARSAVSFTDSVLHTGNGPPDTALGRFALQELQAPRRVALPSPPEGERRPLPIDTTTASDTYRRTISRRHTHDNFGSRQELEKAEVASLELQELRRDNATQAELIARLQDENAELKKAQSRLRIEVSNAVHKAAAPCSRCAEKDERHARDQLARDVLLEDLRQSQQIAAKTPMLEALQAECDASSKEIEALRNRLEAVEVKITLYTDPEHDPQP